MKRLFITSALFILAGVCAAPAVRSEEDRPPEPAVSAPPGAAPAELIPPGSPAAEQPGLLGMTRVRAVGMPVGTFVTQEGATQLAYVKLTVRNVGEAPAREVSVKVILPDGKEVELQGPKELPRGDGAVYSASPAAAISSTRHLKSAVSCGNCKR